MKLTDSRRCAAAVRELLFLSADFAGKNIDISAVLWYNVNTVSSLQ